MTLSRFRENNENGYTSYREGHMNVLEGEEIQYSLFPKIEVQ